MLLCDVCGEIFDEGEAKTVRQRFSIWGNVDACPRCGSVELSEAKRCGYCDQYIDADQLEENNGLCTECAEKTRKDLTRLILDNFNHTQIQYLREDIVSPEVLA